MRKILALIIAIMLICSPAMSESIFISGGNAANIGNSAYMILDEEMGKALVRASGEARIADRAADINSLTVYNGALYYLRKTEGKYALIRKVSDLSEEVAYEFDRGVSARGLSVYGENLFVLLDSKLNIIYPEKMLVIALASTLMREYAIHEDYAYFISDNDTLDYDSPAKGSGGCLYKLNLSEYTTSLVVKAGIEDLKYLNGKLYFHNLSDGYAYGSERTLRGKLYEFDLANETLTKLHDDYDWDYFVISGEIYIYNEYGLVKGSDVVQKIPQGAIVADCGNGLIAYDRANNQFTHIEFE